MQSMVEGANTTMRASPKTFSRARKLRRSMTLPEIILWSHLRSGKLGALKFRRQHPLGPFVLDFYCPALRLCIEVDGLAHDSIERAAQDENRDRWLADKSIKTLRFPARNILDERELESVLRSIAEAATPVSHGKN